LRRVEISLNNLVEQLMGEVAKCVKHYGCIGAQKVLNLLTFF